MTRIAKLKTILASIEVKLNNALSYILTAFVAAIVSFLITSESINNSLDILLLTSYQDSLNNHISILNKDKDDLYCEIYNRALYDEQYLTKHTVEGGFVIGAPELALETENSINEALLKFDSLKLTKQFEHCKIRFKEPCFNAL